MKYSDLELAFDIQRALLDLNAIRHKEGLGRGGKRIEAAFMRLPHAIRLQLAHAMLCVIKPCAETLQLHLDASIEGFTPSDAWDLNG